MTNEQYLKNKPEIPEAKEIGKNDKFTFVSLRGCLDCSGREEPLKFIDQILSTFKFIPQIYTACGCGCCGGVEPETKCLYHSKGDDIQKIIDADKSAAKSADCTLMGCAKGIKYSYCD